MNGFEGGSASGDADADALEGKIISRAYTKVKRKNFTISNFSDNFDISDCTTQRNLDGVGRDQSKRLGKFFKINNIYIDTVLSSEWCRCQETAKLAFNKYETFSALNSFYDQKFYKNKDRQLDELKNFIRNLEEDGNIVFVTHYVVIASMFGIGISSGEILVTDKDLNVIGTIEDY